MDLHLIKGKPAVHGDDDLIVSHIAISVPDMGAMFKKLKELNTKYRQISIYGMEKKLPLKTWITKKSSTYKKLTLLQVNKSNLFISAGCSLSDQHILSPINPEYNNWFCQIYEDLHKFFWNCLQIIKFRTKFVKLTKSVFIFWVNW